MGIGYLAGASCLGMSGDIGFSCGLDSIVCPFVNISWTASISDNCESQILVGTYLSSAFQKCKSWVILSSGVTWVCVRYSCKYSAVSVIMNSLVFYVNFLDTAVVLERRSYTKSF